MSLQQIERFEEHVNIEDSSTNERMTEMKESTVVSLEKNLHGQQGQVTAENSILSKKRKRRRDSPRKEYSKLTLASAIDDLRSGQTLVEAATKHNIPRTTLYMRAKTLGIPLSARNEYSTDCMNAAIAAVMGICFISFYFTCSLFSSSIFLHSFILVTQNNL